MRVVCARVGFHGSADLGILHLVLLLVLLLGGAALQRCGQALESKTTGKGMASAPPNKGLC